MNENKLFKLKTILEVSPLSIYLPYLLCNFQNNYYQLENSLTELKKNYLIKDQINI